MNDKREIRPDGLVAMRVTNRAHNTEVNNSLSVNAFSQYRVHR
jgi:hypothetical protein